MDKIYIAAASQVTESDARLARLGPRFGRLDLASQLALLAVEALAVDFPAWPRDRVGICLASRAGSITTDVGYWHGRDAAGGPSPTLFAYTLPARPSRNCHPPPADRPKPVLRRRRRCGVVRGPRMDPSGEVEACLCISCQLVSPAAAVLIQSPPVARACAIFLRRGGGGRRELAENDRDIESICAHLCAQNFPA